MATDDEREHDEIRASAISTINRIRTKSFPDIVTSVSEEIERLMSEKERYTKSPIEREEIGSVTTARDSMTSLVLAMPCEQGQTVISFEYSVTKAKGLFSRKRVGTFLVFCNDEVVGSHFYDLPSLKKPMSSADVTKIVDTIDNLILRCGYKGDDEQRIVQAVAHVTGIPKVATAYLTRESACVYSRVQNSVVDFLNGCVERLRSTVDGLEKALATLNEDHLREFIESEKLRGKERVDKVVTELKLELLTYRQEAESVVERRRVALEDEYQQKLQELEFKLRGQREKVRGDAFKISSGLEEIFPDRTETEYDRFRKYDERVDNSLRKFYEMKMLGDLSASEGFSVDNALIILKCLKEVCIHRKNRASGSELREVYAGLRAVLHYVGTHEIDIPVSICRIIDIGKEINGRTPKPSVEELLERAFPYDFKLETYFTDLHNLKAASKEELELK